MDLNQSCLVYDNLPKTTAQLALWNGDEPFQAALKLIQGRSLLDVPRLWTLWNAVRQVEKINPGSGGHVLEVGIYRGGSAVILAKAIGSILQRREIYAGVREWMGEESIQKPANPKLYLADTFEGLVDAGQKDNAHHNGDFKVDEAEVRAFLQKHAPEATILKGRFPETFMGMGGELRLVHCDVDTYESTFAVIKYTTPLLLVGGMIIVDDFGFVTCMGAAKAVSEFWSDNRLVCTYNLTGQAILTKIRNT